MPAPRLHRCAAPLAGAALLAGCAVPAGTQPPTVPFPSGLPTTAVTAATCPAGGVRFEVGESDAAMGLRVLGITLVNCGPGTYRLHGYPAVRPLGEDRAALKVRVLHGVRRIVGTALAGDGPPVPVVLAPGERAGAIVAWRNTYDDIREPPVTVRLLDVAPLAGRPSQLVDPRGGLDVGSTGRIAVSAWSHLPDGGVPTSPARPRGPGVPASAPAVTGGPLP